MLSRSTLTRGSPRKPNCRPSVCSSTSARTAAGSAPRSRATRATCRCGVGGRDVRVQSRRGRGHHVRRDLALLGAVLLHHLVHRLRDQRVGELQVGGALVGAAPTRSRRTRRRPPTGAGMEVVGRGERLTDELAADRLPVDADERAVGLAREEQLGDGRDHAGIEQTRDGAEQQRQHDSGTEVFARSWSHQVQGDEDDVDGLDPDERDDHPADAVDDEVAPQDGWPPRRAGTGRPAAPAGSAR